MYYLDRDRFGPLMRYVVNVGAEARYAEDDLHKVVMKQISDFFKEHPKLLESGKAKINVPELQHEGINWIQTRGDLRALMLNLGTVENYSKLLGGFGWSPEAIDLAHLRHATEEDWQYVQKIWQIHDETLWPKIVETYRDPTVSGVPPRKKQGRIVQTAFGPVQGGYYHIQYDQGALERMGLKDPTLRDPTSVLGGEYKSAAPANNFTKAVSGFQAPLSLDSEHIPQMFSQIIHDISWRRALIQMNKVLNHPEVVRAFQDVVGPEWPGLNRHWLEYIAREAVYSGSGSDGLARWIRGVRSNYVSTMVLYKASTIFTHTPIAALHMFGQGGLLVPGVAKDIYGQAFLDMFRSPGQLSYWMNFIDEKSGEMRNVEYGIDRDITTLIGRAEDTPGLPSAVKMRGAQIFAALKKLEGRITWLAEYNKQMAANNDEEAAIGLANKAVRDTQGSGGTMDSPPLLRGGHDAIGEAGRLFSTFMSFRNVSFQREWRLAMAARNGATGHDDPMPNSAIFNTLLWFFVLPTLWLVLKAKTFDRSSKDFGTLLGESALHSTVGSSVMGDIVSDVAAQGLEGERHSIPAEEVNTYAEAFKELAGTPVKQPIRVTADALGYAGLGVPDQAGIAAQHAFDVATGATTDPGLLAAVHGYLAGSPKSSSRSLHRGLR
jgi:hypothetical protein